MRGSSTGSLRLPGRGHRRAAAGAIQPLRRMSGPSVSTTMQRPAPACAPGAGCRARSKVMAPPKPSLKPSSTKACACCALPLKAWRCRRRPRSAQVLEQGIGRAPHMQDHRQAGRSRSSAARRRSAPGARGRARARSDQVDLADRHQPAGRRAARQFGVEPSDLRPRAIDVERVDAERVGAAVGVRQRAPPRNAPPRPPAAPAAPPAGGRGHHGVAVGVELRGVEVAVRVDPHGRDDACCDGADTGRRSCYRNSASRPVGVAPEQPMKKPGTAVQPIAAGGGRHRRPPPRPSRWVRRRLEPPSRAALPPARVRRRPPRARLWVAALLVRARRPCCGAPRPSRPQRSRSSRSITWSPVAPKTARLGRRQKPTRRHPLGGARGRLRPRPIRKRPACRQEAAPPRRTRQRRRAPDATRRAAGFGSAAWAPAW